MAALPDVFKASEVEGSSSFEVMPEGWYIAQITKSEFKENSKGTGKYLALSFTIVDGQHSKRMFFTNLNLVNQNPTAVEIANRTLKDICTACGLDEIEDSEELHGIPMAVKLKVKPSEGKWPERNEPVAYKPESELPEGYDDNPF